MYDAFFDKLTAVVKAEVEVTIQITDRDTYSQIKQWCFTEFGRERSINRSGRWWIGAEWNDCHAFRFENEVDAMAFKLRWC